MGKLTTIGIPPGGSTGQVLKKKTGTNYDVEWGTGGGGATPGGTDTQVQFNDGGSSLGGDAGFTYNKTTNTATIENLIVTTSISGNGVNNNTASVGGRLYLFNAY